MALVAGYPAGKIGADTAEKICEKVEDGETDAEEIAEDVSEEAEKWSSENLDVEKMFTEKSIEHLEEIEGFDKNNGVKGSHTLECFNKFTEGPRPVEILNKEKISDGIYEIQYKVGKIDKANNPILKSDGSYDFFGKNYIKTVIDTTEICIEQVTSMAKEAFASKNIYIIEENNTYIKGTSINGVKFEGWINPTTQKLESFYPVKDWKHN